MSETNSTAAAAPAAPAKRGRKPKAVAGVAIAPETVPDATPETQAADKGRGRPKASGGLTSTEVKVLGLLYKAKDPMTRQDLANATGIKKGWSKLLGAATKGIAQGKGLEGKGLVKSLVPEEEGGRAMRYQITSAGRKALEKAEKQAPK